MLEIELQFEDGTHRIVRVQPPVVLGRAPHCGIRIRHWRVGREHARFVVSGQDVVIEDAGTLSGTLVNGKRIARYGPLTSNDEVLVGPCLMKVRREPFLPITARALPAAADVMPLSESTLRDVAADRHAYGLEADARDIGEMSDMSDMSDMNPAVDLLPHRQRLQSALLDALDLRRRDVAKMSDSLLRSEAAERLLALVREDTQIPAGVDPDALMREVLDEALGFGPLSPLLEDPGVTEIMVNRHDQIYVERDGRLVRHAAAFSSEQAVLRVLERIVAPIGRRIDESSPMVDARLADGSRVNAVVAPVALKGATLTIRKFPQRALGMPDLVRRGSLDTAMADFLARCVAERVNIVVSGGTGSGKTTLLNILSNAIPGGERIITIEDAAELRLRHAHVVALEARPANMEGRGHITIRDLVRNALRMRPDRIVVGECRGAEAFDMLAAMNTGHEGSLTTLHANSPRDALGRLETMILMAGMDLPLAAVREHIASSIHLIVQQARMPDGRRLVTAIVEVTGMEAGRIQTQPLFMHEGGGARGGFAGCGTMPTFADAWRDAGRPLDPMLFTGTVAP
ncbi:secretion protein [Bordetella genomosp. 9]|uniref:Secretion protein n=1 Tax=Bordetella genomosp. 9 TaxID=1416803 RepID=A0A261RG41_9BORD|nr:ATPase, T2SS/T4P/T4SS family [Bordetella genomosp. 9]OZI23642.1 secretion protein [Bordetella genomosp. 9]